MKLMLEDAAVADCRSDELTQRRGLRAERRERTFRANEHGGNNASTFGRCCWLLRCALTSTAYRASRAMPPAPINAAAFAANDLPWSLTAKTKISPQRGFIADQRRENEIRTADGSRVIWDFTGLQFPPRRSA